ncbi:MAG TPA: hypothetical protein VLC54_12470 [Anaeromyxobacter sp.]|nr:hypothetical protein [Anaeromyxobacter sp.]
MTDREFLRHTMATLAYRAAKAMRGAPPSFATFQAGPSSRMPVEIVAHMGDLMDWGLSMARGQGKWNSATPRSWDDECRRFFASAKAFDDALAGPEPVHYDLTRLFQGPVADALTHTGQLAMLRRIHGAPMKGESYNRADIVAGRVTADQTPADPRFEFD